MSDQITMDRGFFDEQLLMAKKAERERIIKLLEDEELHTHPNNLMKNYDELVCVGIKEQLIALIKGENK